MTFAVTEACILCKYADCVEVCPVDCFYEGENMLVIHPDECIDCGVCEPECPAEAIIPGTAEGAEKWIELNAKYAVLWPNITESKGPPADAEDFNGVAEIRKIFLAEPGHRTGDLRPSAWSVLGLEPIRGGTRLACGGDCPR